MDDARLTTEEILDRVREQAFAQGKSAQEADELADRVLAEALDERVNAVLERMKATAQEKLGYDRKLYRGFERRLRNHWGAAFDQMYLVVSSVGEVADLFCGDTEQQESEELRRALIGLLARACRVGAEVHYLLTGGFPMGAAARARTLHEILVVVVLLARYDGTPGYEDFAIRYLEHRRVLNYKDALSYQENHEGLGLHRLDDADVDRMKSDRDEVIKRYGKSYKEQNGWAAQLFTKERPTIADLEELAGLKHLRGVYAWMSHEVHSDAKGWSLNFVERAGVSTMLTGRLNVGAEDAALLAMESMENITRHVLRSRYWKQEYEISIGVLSRMIDAARGALEEGGRSVDRAEKRYQAKQRKQRL